MKDTAPKAKSYELSGLSGVDAGTVFSLDDSPLTVRARFLVARDGDFWVVRSLAGREVMVGGELVVESILTPGDSIITEAGEYAFRQKSRLGLRLRLSPGVILLILVAFTAYAAMSVLPLLKELQTLRSPAPAAAAAGPAAKITDPSERTRRLGSARVLFAVALGNAGDSRYAPDRLAVAVRQLDDIERMLASLDPPPPELKTILTYRATAKERLDAAKDVVRRNAVIALQADRFTSYKECLLQLMALANDPDDKDYRWALERLRNIP